MRKRRWCWGCHGMCFGYGGAVARQVNNWPRLKITLTRPADPAVRTSILYVGITIEYSTEIQWIPS